MATLPLDSETLHAVICIAAGLPYTATQESVAAKIGMSQALYSRLVRGERMSAEKLAERVRVLGLVDLANAIDGAAMAYREAMEVAEATAKRNLAENINLHVARELGRLSGAGVPRVVRQMKEN